MDDQFFNYFLSTFAQSRALSNITQCQDDSFASNPEGCKLMAKRVCQSSLLTVINSIRLSHLDTAMWKLLTAADVRIYITIRDPRAIVSSLLSHVTDPESNRSRDLAASYTQVLCARIQGDIDRSDSLSGKWLSYETFVHNPEDGDLLQNVYDAPIPEVVRSWLKKNTRQSAEVVGIDWKNSKEVGDKWGKEMDIDLQLVITRITTTPPCNLVKLDYPANVLEWF